MQRVPGLATGEMRLLDAWRRFFRELKVALVNGVTRGAVLGTDAACVGVDPAVAAGPFVTISNDILGLFIYLGLASALLSWL